MNKTNDILEKLKAAEQPVIDNPDELTDLIMSSLPEQDAPQKEQPQKPQASFGKTERPGICGCSTTM